MQNSLKNRSQNILLITLKKKKMTHLEKITDLYNNYIYRGKLIDGFEKYYGQNVVMQELGEEPRIGKDFNRQHEEKFVSNIEIFHDGGIIGIASDESNKQTFVESWMDITIKDGQRFKLQQVAVQKWDGNHIVNEMFYHK
jgi:hypothetical protein